MVTWSKTPRKGVDLTSPPLPERERPKYYASPAHVSDTHGSEPGGMSRTGSNVDAEVRSAGVERKERITWVT